MLNIFLNAPHNPTCPKHTREQLVAPKIQDAIYFSFRKFKPMAFVSDDCALYHQTKKLVGFWCRWELNLKSLIKLSETLPIE